MLSHNAALRLESQIEHRTVELARKKGYFVLKLDGNGHSGWPDRMFILPHGKVIFIEFKRPGGKLSARQRNIISKLKDKGHTVEVCYSVEEAIGVLDGTV